MRWQVFWLMVGFGSALVPTAVQARDFLYPWKSGATLQQASDDQGGCMADAETMRKATDAEERQRMRGRPSAPPPSGSKSWLAPGLDGQAIFFNRYYDCLRARGYSIRRMPSREYASLKKGADGGMAVMRMMIAPASPHAEVLPGTIK